MRDGPALTAPHADRPWGRNVVLGLVWTALEYGSRTVRGGDLLSVLLFNLSGSHASVGYIQVRRVRVRDENRNVGTAAESES